MFLIILERITIIKLPLLSFIANKNNKRGILIMGSRTSMIKRFGFAVAGLVMILALAACGGGGDSDSEGSGGSEGSDGDVKLTLWAWPGFGLQDLVDQYEDENPGISIEIQEADYADV